MLKPRSLRHPALERREREQAREALHERELATLLLVYLAGMLPPALLLLLIFERGLAVLSGIYIALFVVGLGLSHWLAGRRVQQLMPEAPQAQSGSSDGS